jgi:hexokinase
MAGFNNDSRVLMTLDAGGTSFRFRALRGNQQVTQTIAMATEANSLSQKKENMKPTFYAIYI